MPGIDTYIFKTASICNLNCSYCYYYNGADTSFQGRPSLMSAEVMNAAVEKIVTHTVSHRLDRIDITLHGGEPLIMGKENFRLLMGLLDRIDEAGVTTRRKIQTNGVLLDPEWIDLLATHDILLGISMDGPRSVHDRFRVDHQGGGSYDRVVRGLQLALADPRLSTSVLSVVDPTQDGAAMYRHLRGLGVERMDFLIAEANYAHPPIGYEPLGTATPVAEFLTSVFDAWIAEDDPKVTVRILDRIMRELLGGEARSEIIGTAPVRVAVVEADGALEPTDNYKVCEDRITDLGLSVFTDEFDDLLEHPFFARCIRASEMVPDACHACPYLGLCGGGPMATRFSAEEDFARRTIYCNDLFGLYRHIEKGLDQMLPELTEA